MLVSKHNWDISLEAWWLTSGSLATQSATSPSDTLPSTLPTLHPHTPGVQCSAVQCSAVFTILSLGRAGDPNLAEACGLVTQ